VTWTLAAVGNLLTAFTYAVIAASVFVRLRRTGQLSMRVNPLGIVMALVFSTVAVRAAWLGGQLLLPEFGIDHPAALALRNASTWASVPLPYIAAAVGFLYLWMRRRAGDAPGEASLYPDLSLRRRRALEINDNIVQGLIASRALDELGEREEARAVLDETLGHAQEMMADLLEESGELRPGHLRRSAPQLSSR
jgi:hypothetical protein